MNNQQAKFESPVRIEELKPNETLNLIGLEENDVVCDIGAGSGVFTLPAARMTRNTVYALDINDGFLSIIKEKAEKEGIKNIELVKVCDGSFGLDDNTVDLALMVAVLHEVSSPEAFLQETGRILKNNGRVVLIEFHKRQTQFGPPVDLRIDKNWAKKIFTKAGFKILKDFKLGENYYCLIFSQFSLSKTNYKK